MSKIRRWLESQGMGQYAEAFEANDIELDLITELTDEGLRQLGVSSLGHRLRLLGAIKSANISSVSAIASQAVPSQTPLPTIAHASVGERRQATVLFSDVSGYTAMNERLDPEEVRAIVGRIKAEAVRIVEGHGGIVNQFVGDEVMALFGVPQAHEDDPVRAVRAARDLHAMVHTLAPAVESRIGAPLRLHSGISAGLIVTGTEDRRDGTFGVTGDAVNTGARLAAHAEADTVLVSEEIQRIIADYFETEPLAPVELKGKAGRVTPYRVAAQTGIASRFEAAAQRGFTAYVGRESELALLNAALAKTRQGQGQFVTVMGEPGIGKSRLLFEFRHSLPRDEVSVLTGYCQSYGTDTPYLPMVDALKRALRLDEMKGAEALHDDTVAAVRAVSPALERYLPQYLHLLSIPSQTHKILATLQGDARRRSFEEALAAIITENAKRQPLVLILEDWHWSDEASESALKHLSGLVPHHPLQVVMTYRPEYERKEANPWHYTPLVLQPLAERDTAAMLRAVWRAEHLPEGLAEQVHARTGGNALFNEEVARALAEDGKISVIAGRAVLKGTLADLHLPETVHAVIRARVDRLAPEAHEVLRLASVIGREFALPLLERLHSAPHQIPAALDMLTQQDLIHPLRVVPEPAYLFKHALVQDVAYDMLLLSQRKTLHRQVATAIEALYADRIEEQYENLANQYEKSEVYGKAIEYLEKAADKAASYSSLQEARGYCQRTVTLLNSINETISEQETRIRMTLKWAEIGTGFPTPELAAASTRALQCAKNLGARSQTLSIASWEAHIRTMLGETERGLALAEFVIAEGSPSVGDPAIGRAHTVLGMSSVWSGRPVSAVNHARLGRLSLQNGMGPFWDRYLLNMSGLSAALVGDFKNSMHWFNQAMKLPDTERSIKSWIHVFLGYSLNEQSKWAEASESARKGHDIARHYDDPWPAAWALITDGYARFMAGQHRDGHSLLCQGIRELEARSLLYTISWAYALLAEVSLILNNLESGVKLSEASKDSLRDGDRIAEPMTYRALAIGDALSESAEWSSILSHLKNAVVIALQAGRLPQAALSYFRYAECLHKKGEVAAALEQLSEAERLFAEMEMTWWSEQASGLRARIEASKPFVWFAPYVDGPPELAS
jgi:class 3 adenylate cyclase/tetratricopeptide (TPR) repeat protein